MTREKILDMINNTLGTFYDDEFGWSSESTAVLSVLEDAGLIWTPESNTTQCGLLTSKQQAALKAAKNGWEIYLIPDGWRESLPPPFDDDYVYRAKPEPVVKSVWANVYFEADDFDNYGVRLSPAFYSRKTVDHIAGSNRIGVARFDLIDGELSVELQPLDSKEPE